MISIVIILKNDREIVNTINGINRQNYSGEFEIIVIDRSTISYPEIKSIASLHWINYDPKGKKYTIPEQRNVGIKKSKGEIVVFIDASCVPEDDWLTNLLEPIFNNNEKIVMGKTGSVGKATINDLSHQKLIGRKYVNEAPTINLAICKEVFDKVGIFDEYFEFGSDIDFTWRAIDSGYKIRYQPSAYVVHNWGDSKQEFKRNILYGKARARLLIRHFKTRWKNLIGKDAPVLIYPLIIIFLPLILIFPWYLFIFLILILKNIKEPQPIGIVVNHFIYGLGVLIEVKDQLRK